MGEGLTRLLGFIALVLIAVSFNHHRSHPMIYAVQISRSDTAAITVLVRADSKAAARAHVSKTMIHVERATDDQLLRADRSKVINADPNADTHTDDEPQLPLGDNADAGQE